MKRIIALCCIVLFVFACEEKKAADPPAAGPAVKEQPAAAPTAAEQPAEEAKADEKAPEATAEAKADEQKHAPGATCSCSAGKAGGTTWCGGCGVGYIKGEKTKDKAAVDAASKAFKAEEAPKADGAEAPKAPEAKGAHAGQHGLAHARACTCGAGKAGGTTWCEGCKKGYIKGVASTDKAAVAAALSDAKPTE